MIDLVYIIADKESINNDLELLYSLRSVEKYVGDYNNIFITGRCPDFIDRNKVIYTPCKDIGAPMTNHWHKVRETIIQNELDGDFVLMYDDIFFVKPTNLTNYPFYQRGKLGESTTGGEHYRATLLNARDFLVRKGYNTYDHELHIPCIYNADTFMALDRYFMALKDDCQSMAVRSVYGNMAFEEQPYRGDIKIRSQMERVKYAIGVADCFSVSDDMFQFDTYDWLKKDLGKQSRWEK